MIAAKIRVNGTYANTIWANAITAGMVGAKIRIDYGPEWDGLTKTVVFRGSAAKDVVTDAADVDIPAECVAVAGAQLEVGIYGIRGQELAIPTLWARLGRVQRSADPSGDTTTDPSLPVWAQIHAMIGDLDKLDTKAKSDLVAAVNEALANGGGTVDEETVRKIVADYLAENPPAPGEPGSDGGYYSPSVSQPDANTMTVSFAPSKDGMEEVPDKNITLPKGETGKSAYQYAVDGGYTGTEAEFAAKLAAGIFSVTITQNSDGTLSADKTYVELAQALISGYTIFALYEGFSLPIIGISDAIIFGATNVADNSAGSIIVAIAPDNTVTDNSGQIDIPDPATVILIDDISSTQANLTPAEILTAVAAGKVLMAIGGVCTVMTYANDGSWVMLHRQYNEINKVAEIKINADKSYSFTLHTLVADTTALPNPHALTINGTSYDGSAPVDLAIDGGSGISVTGATVGQTVKIAAVDDNGVPTAWEAVDFPSGGDETWELLADITTDEDAWLITASGDWPKCKKYRIAFYGQTSTTNEGYLALGGFADANRIAPSLNAKYRSYDIILSMDDELGSVKYEGYAVGETWGKYPVFAGAGKYALSGYCKSINKNYDTMPIINSISAYVYNDAYIAGTRLAVWGCK